MKIGIKKLEDFKGIANTLGEGYVFFNETEDISVKEYELITIDRKARVMYKYRVWHMKKDESEEASEICKVAEKLSAINCGYIDDSVLTYSPEM